MCKIRNKCGKKEESDIGYSSISLRSVMGGGIFLIWGTSSEGSFLYIYPLRLVVTHLWNFCGYFIATCQFWLNHKLDRYSFHPLSLRMINYLLSFSQPWQDSNLRPTAITTYLSRSKFLRITLKESKLWLKLFNVIFPIRKI